MRNKSKHQLSHVLKRLMAQCHIDDIKLAKLTDVPFTTIARMRANENANPTISSLRPLAKYFGLSMSQLIGDAPITIGQQHAAQQDSVLHIPLLAWPQIESWTQKTKLDPDLSNTAWITTHLPLSVGSYALTVSNRSYGPPFGVGATLLVDPAALPISEDYVIMQLKKEGEMLFKKIIFDGEHVYLKCVNPELTETIILKEPYHYHGIVVEVRQQLHHDSFTKLKPAIESGFKPKVEWA